MAAVGAQVIAKRQEVQYLTVAEQHEGRRIDNYLISVLGRIPKSRIYRMLRSGEVRVNGRRARPDRRLMNGDRLRIPPLHVSPGTATPGGQEFPAPVLYEDDTLLVIDKPTGLSVHAGTGVTYGLIERARAASPKNQYLELVHRLDRETSGCLMLAKEPRRLRELHELLRSGEVKKRYLALVAGRWPGTTDVKQSLRRTHEGGRGAKMTVSTKGKPAVSRFESAEQFNRATLMEVELFSGRTHQIRVHAADQGHPVAGDSRYGDRGFNRKLRRLGLKRLFLHANMLAFPDAAGDGRTVVSSTLPSDLRAVLERLE